MRYICGPSVLRLAGQAAPVQPGDAFEHDFSEEGPEGEHGPSREAALIAAGAMTPAPIPVTPAATTAADHEKE